jgi:hypothetical protein
MQPRLSQGLVDVAWSSELHGGGTKKGKNMNQSILGSGAIIAGLCVIIFHRPIARGNDEWHKQHPIFLQSQWGEHGHRWATLAVGVFFILFGIGALVFGGRY